MSAAASDPKEYLGHFLVSHGFLDELTLAKAMEMQEANRMLLGKILVTIGAITEEDLNRMLQLKVEESIYEIFTWPEGDFDFADGELPSFAMVPFSLGVTRLVLEGYQRLDEWKRMREHVPSPLCVPVAVARLQAPADDAGSATILSMVNDDRTIQDISLETHASEFHVMRVLFRQLEEGRLKVVRPRTVEVAAQPAPQRGAVSEAIDSRSLLRSGRAHLDAREFELALRHLRAARSLEPESPTVRKEVDKAEALIEAAIAEDGVRLSAVPELARDLETLGSLDISPQEGFILTRINGSYDIRTILKISPMPTLDAQVVFWKLLNAGHIRLSGATVG